MTGCRLRASRIVAVATIILYIDADACPVKQEVYRAAERRARKGVPIKARPYSVMAGVVPAIHVSLAVR